GAWLSAGRGAARAPTTTNSGGDRSRAEPRVCGHHHRGLGYFCKWRGSLLAGAERRGSEADGEMLRFVQYGDDSDAVCRTPVILNEAKQSEDSRVPSLCSR